MKPRIAISAPMSVPLEHLSEVKELLQLRYEIPGSFISYWDRKSAYDQNVFNNADAVVVILNDFAFDSSKSDYFIPIGVHRELQEANKQHKNVFLAYKRKSDNVLNLYNATYILGKGDNFKDTSIKGICSSGSSGDSFNDWLKSKLKEENNKLKEETIKKWDAAGFDVKSSGIDAQAFLDKAAHRLMTNSTYGAFGELDHPSESEQIKLPNARRFYAQLVSQHQFDNGFDERLLLML